MDSGIRDVMPHNYVPGISLVRLLRINTRWGLGAKLGRLPGSVDFAVKTVMRVVRN